MIRILAEYDDPDNEQLNPDDFGTSGLSDGSQLFSTTASTLAERWDATDDPIPSLVASTSLEE